MTNLLLGGKQRPFAALWVAMLWLLVAGAYSACRNEDDQHDQDENELITTLRLTATNAANAADVRTFSFADTDGDGGNPPTIDTIVLAANAVYEVSISVLDESKTPAVDISAEIAAKKNEHQFFFTPSNGLNLSNTYQDTDDNNLPVGLQTRFTTTAPSSGTLSVTLKHQPDTKNNNIATGSTDIMVDFPTRIP